MKKILFIILCFVTLTNLQAQLASWGTPLKVKEAFSMPNQPVHGTYLATFDGADYYTYYSRRPVFVKLEDTRFAFIEVKGTRVTKFTPYSEAKYDYLNVSATESELSVAYIVGEKKAPRNVKVDYYAPSTLKKTKSITLFTFSPIDKDDPYITMVKSENGEYVAVVANGKHPDTGLGTFIIKCYNKNYEEVWNSYYDYQGNGYIEIGDIMLSNTGKVIMHFPKYESNKKKKLESYVFTQISDGSINELSHDFEDKVDIIDYKIGEYKDDQFLMVYTQESSIHVIKIDFTEENSTELFTHPTYDGNWRVDKIADLKNGNFTVAVQNRDLFVYTRRGANNTIETSYIYWNKSFIFIGINGNTEEKAFAKTLGRDFDVAQGIPSAEFHIYIEPFYFVKDGDLHVVYNTMLNTKDNVSKKTEKPNYVSLSLPKFSFKVVTKMAVISDNGNLNVKTIFNSKTDKGFFLSKFSHINSDNDLIIAKAKKKVLTIGKVNL